MATNWIKLPKTPNSGFLWSEDVFPWLLALPWQYIGGPTWVKVTKAT